MKNSLIFLCMVIGLFMSVNTLAQNATPDGKLSVEERMAKARAARAEKRSNASAANQSGSPQKVIRATPADYKAPVDKVQKGPNGEVVYTGERGGKYYINKNGNKTFLSSNQ
ncbi:hypothetical protein J2I47_08125 [Fibrella sp. HMF5335]|uniref:Colicin import membrane protein n=1 Tax=Fibrella rubiginis TaxID=2817060 RepID=A0A939K5I6_9BACT|nr:hypothetical protein [Fibrella rubiginis]MBO0936505.1 hypothetical protein [Fibrella rubiginis]